MQGSLVLAIKLTLTTACALPVLLFTATAVLATPNKLERNSSSGIWSKSCSEASNTPEWEGKSYSKVTESFGPPLISDEFEPSDAVLTEFRAGLWHLKRKTQDLGPVIRESTWAVKDCRLTIWFSKEKSAEFSSIHTLYWHKDMEF